MCNSVIVFVPGFDQNKTLQKTESTFLWEQYTGQSRTMVMSVLMFFTFAVIFLFTTYIEQSSNNKYS